MSHAAENQQEQGQPVLHHDLDPDGGNGGHHQKIQSCPGKTLHLSMVDQVILLDFLHSPLNEQAADHAEREQREPGKDPFCGIREHFDFHLLEEGEGNIAQGHRKTDEGNMPRQRIQRVAENRLPSGRGHFALLVKAFAAEFILSAERNHLRDIAFVVRPVDKDHADHDCKDHPHGGHGVTQGNAFAPVVGFKGAGHTANGAVPAFKTDFQQVAEGRIDAEKGSEDKTCQPQSQHILPPRKDLAETQLGECGFDDGFHAGSYHPEEEGGKDDIDQEARQFGHVFSHIRGQQIGETLQQDEADQSADHRTGQIQSLQKGNVCPEQFANHKKKT